MTYFTLNIDSLVGLFLISIAICTIIFPPKFGNTFYGVITRWTLKNEIVWAVGHKLFAGSIIAIGLVFLVIGNSRLREAIPPFYMVLLLFGLWTLSKYFVQKILERKYPGI
jgi:uncharacterized membrane protein